MMNYLRKTVLVFMTGLLCSTAAFAGDEVDLGDGTSRLGAEDNTTGWWSQFTDFVEIAPNKTLTYTFKNYSSKVYNWNNWAVNIVAESNYEYLIMRADCFGWSNGNFDAMNTGDADGNDNTWFTCNWNNYDWGNFIANLDGATVVMTIKRNDASLILIEDVTTADGTKKFRHFFEMDVPASVDEILKARLTVDNAHLIINNEVPVVDSAPLSTATGTQVGRSDLATPWWTAFSDYYTVQPNETGKVHFKNYSCKVGNWNNWLLGVTSDADRGGDGYEEYVILRSDNWGWGTKWNEANITNDYDWATFKDEMDGADVTIEVTREGGKVTVTATAIAATDGTTVRTETYTFTDDEIANDNIRVFLTTEGGMLDILPDAPASDMVDLGDGTSRLGAEDNTDGWFSKVSDQIEIPANKTLTYTFKNYSSKANNWNCWVLQLVEKSTNEELLIGRGDCYMVYKGGWDNGMNTGEGNDNTWYNTNQNNYNWEDFVSNLDGATVVMNVKRVESDLIITEDVITADGTYTFRHYFSMPYANADETLLARLSIDNSHLIINNEVPVVDSKTIAINGKQVGNADMSSLIFDALSETYTVEHDGSVKLNFKNYSSKVFNWNNWILAITSDADRGGDGYEEYVVLRADNWGWGTKWNDANITNDYDWATFKDEMDGADVTIEVTREGGKVTVTAKAIAATDGTTVRTETYTFTDDEIANDKIRVFLTTEGGMLDVMSGVVTGINTVKNVNNAKAETYYDLSGRRVAHPTKGLYIVNGKKIIK
ncbi:MAG: hypothetical protein IJ069_08420 [Prevotella sp.]|nr:hypothetical protein [Prevotella sp.]